MDDIQTKIRNRAILMEKIKSLCSMIVVTSFMIMMFLGTVYGASVNIFILNTGDIHESSKNLDKISQYIAGLRQNNPGRVILLDAGDMLTHFKRVAPESDWEGQHDRMYGWASSMNYSAMVFGNHDFVGGVKVTQQLIDKYQLPFICANLVHPDLSIQRVPPYRIIPLNINLSELQLPVRP